MLFSALSLRFDFVRTPHTSHPLPIVNKHGLVVYPSRGKAQAPKVGCIQRQASHSFGPQQVHVDPIRALLEFAKQTELSFQHSAAQPSVSSKPGREL